MTYLPSYAEFLDEETEEIIETVKSQLAPSDTYQSYRLIYEFDYRPRKGIALSETEFFEYVKGQMNICIIIMTNKGMFGITIEDEFPEYRYTEFFDLENIKIVEFYKNDEICERTFITEGQMKYSHSNSEIMYLKNVFKLVIGEVVYGTRATLKDTNGEEGKLGSAKRELIQRIFIVQWE